VVVQRNAVEAVGTSGGPLVILTGQFFGSVALGPQALQAVSYASDALPHARFVPGACNVTVDDSEIQCWLGSGVGAGLKWVVEVAGQSSSVPRTAYRPPVITALGVMTAGGAVNSSDAAVSQLRTAGGDVVVVMGDYFGPLSPNVVTWLTGISTTACSPLDDSQTRMACTVGPGVGAGLHVSVVVAGQASAPSTQALSFAPPQVLGVVGSGEVPTAGGGTLTLLGTNFGPDPSQVGCAVCWCGPRLESPTQQHVM
jgi:hypothetical protein